MSEILDNQSGQEPERDEVLSRLYVLKAEHERRPIHPHLSIEAAAFLMALAEEDRDLLRAMSGGRTRYQVSRILGISQKRVALRCHALSKRLRLRLAEIDRLAAEYTRLSA